MITIDDELVQSYLAECSKHLAIMEHSLLAIELGGAEADEQLAHRLLQAVHAVKAGAGLFGLGKVGELAHRMERALARVRSHGAAPTPQDVTLLLRALDTLRCLLDDAGASNGADISAISAALAALATGGRQSPKSCRRADWRLRALLVEDDFTSRVLLQNFLARYGDCHVAVNGREAVEAFRLAQDRRQEYDLICMDIMMPEMDGEEAVRHIRAMEEAKGVLSTEGAKIIMVTAVNEIKEVMRCFHDLCDAYVVKPIDLAQLLGHMKGYDLVE